MTENASEISREEVLLHLNQILADRRFASAARMSSFLRYVVERTLEGKADELKETVIAAEVYGRAIDYDPKTDSIVRVEASRLRQKLRTYYEGEGRTAPIRIHLPPGSYIPRFTSFEDEPPAPDVPVPDPLPESPEPRREARRAQLILLTCALAGIALAVGISYSGAPAGTSHTPHPLSVAAVQESVELLAQDPHSAATERGAPATLVRAIERLEFAVATDPEYAAAWARLAEAYDYAHAYVGRDPAQDAARAEAAARRAVQLDGSLSQAHHMLGLMLWGMRWNLPAAEQSYRRALDLDPSNVYAAIEYADLLRVTRRTQQAADVIRSARALQPGLAQLAAKEAEIQLDLGRADAALAAAGDALRLRKDYLRAYVTMGNAEEMKGDFASALKRYEYVLSFDPVERRALPAYGFLLGRMGRTEDARRVAKKLEAVNADIRNCAYQVAVVYAGLAEDDRAIEWLERAWRTRQTLFPQIRIDARFRRMNGNPRFRALLLHADAAAAM